MYQMGVFLAVVLMTIVSARHAHALPNECIQATERTRACPHLIYKKASVAVPLLGVKKNGAICLCLTDLVDVKKTNKSKLELIDQEVTLQRMARKYKISEADLITLVKQ
jgi:hypothetical protein